MVVQMQQKSLAVLERSWISSKQLPNGVDQLRENGSSFFAVALQIAASIRELVTERQPIFFDENLKSLQRSIVRIDQDLGDGAHLSGAIPSYTAKRTIESIILSIMEHMKNLNIKRKMLQFRTLNVCSFQISRSRKHLKESKGTVINNILFRD